LPNDRALEEIILERYRGNDPLEDECQRIVMLLPKISLRGINIASEAYDKLNQLRAEVE
jgi:hypothetical protein